MKVYFYEGYEGGQEESRALLLYALNEFLDESYDKDDIGIGDMGKPYLKDGRAEFSVSHSKKLWMVAISDALIGADLEVSKDKDKDKIAKKIFSELENRYIELWGEYGFYRLWTRREALIKALGLSVFDKMPELVDLNHDLVDSININGTDYYLNDVEIADDIFCAVCSIKDNMQIEMEMIN